MNNGFSAASCPNGIPPNLLNVDTEAPCSPVLELEAAVISPRTASINWKYPSLPHIELFGSPGFFNLSVSAAAGTYFPSLIDSIVTSQNAELTGDATVARFRSCTPFYNNLAGPTSAAWAFQVSVTNQESRETTVFCEYVDTFEKVGDRFGTVVDLLPAQAYFVQVRAFIFLIREAAEASFRFGPQSTQVLLATTEAPPDGQIENVTIAVREADRMELQWKSPTEPNGVIIRYDISVNDGARNETTTTPTIVLRDLQPDTDYSILLRAATRAGAGEWSQRFLVKTCPKSMKSNSAEEVCFATRGFFLDKNGEPIECLNFLSSIEYGLCEQEQLKVEQLSLSSGFWRPSRESIDIRPCPLGATSCAGGLLSVANGTLCQPNYAGPLCTVCATGYFFNGAECDKCDSPNLTSFVPFIAAVGIGLAIVAMVYCFNTYDSNRFSSAGKFALKFKVLITTYQIVGTFTWTLGTAFPSVYNEIVNALLFFTLDLTYIIPGFDCLFQSNYFVELCIVTGAPLAVLLPIFAYWFCGTILSEDVEKVRRTETLCKQALILLTFLVYTPVASKIFRALRECDEFEDLGVSYMPEDYRIECGTAEHTVLLLVAYTMLGVYCLGIPTFYAVLLWPRRNAIQEQCRLVSLGTRRTAKDEGELVALNKELESVSFLFQSYWYWWWELVEILRKIVLAGIIALISPGTAEQSIVLMLLALGSTVLYHHFLPLRDENLLGLVASYTIFFAAFASLLVKLRGDLLDSTVLDILLVVVVCAPFGFALVLSEQMISSLSRIGCCNRSAEAAQAFSAKVSQEFGRSGMYMKEEDYGGEQQKRTTPSKNESRKLGAKHI